MTASTSHGDTFQQRRIALQEALPSDAMAIIPAAGTHLRNGDVHYPYRQASNLMHLTDYPYPEAYLVLMPNHPKGNTWFFCPDYDPMKDRWEGLNWTHKDVKKRFGFDCVVSHKDFETHCLSLAENRRVIYAPLNDPRMIKLMQAIGETSSKGQRQGKQLPAQWHELGDVLDPQRCIKDDAAIAAIQKACDITVEAHKKIMRFAQPGMRGYQIKAKLIEHFLSEGAASEAYPSIVAPGAEACVLHHQDHQALLEKNTLLLVDAGAEYQGYAADVTRTFPIAGRFTAPQKALYNCVLTAQQRVIDAIKPGVSWQHLDHLAAEALTEGLLALGLLSGDLEHNLANGTYRRFYMHRFGHWLGLDVHDVGAYQKDGNPCVLEKGMVFTVEPGLYIDHNAQDVDARWRGIGIRIEDNVLVTDNGVTVLTDALPRDVDALEALTAG